MRKLGEKQKGVLHSLENGRGFWHGHCGWIWDTHSGTVRILESLRKRGYVMVEEHPEIFGLDKRVWHITELGRTIAKEGE